MVFCTIGNLNKLNSVATSYTSPGDRTIRNCDWFLTKTWNRWRSCVNVWMRWFWILLTTLMIISVLNISRVLSDVLMNSAITSENSSSNESDIRWINAREFTKNKSTVTYNTGDFTCANDFGITVQNFDCILL